MSSDKAMTLGPGLFQMAVLVPGSFPSYPCWLWAAMATEPQFSSASTAKASLSPHPLGWGGNQAQQPTVPPANIETPCSDMPGTCCCL